MNCKLCDQPMRAKGLCKRHYGKERYRLNRDKMIEDARAWQAANSDRVAELNKAWRQANKDKLNQQARTRYAKLANGPRVEFGEQVSTKETNYAGAHLRTKRYRGHASYYACPCGRRAEEWAWNHQVNQHTRYEPRPDFQGVLKTLGYSLDVWDYGAMCRSCHVAFDLGGSK